MITESSVITESSQTLHVYMRHVKSVTLRSQMIDSIVMTLRVFTCLTESVTIDSIVMVVYKVFVLCLCIILHDDGVMMMETCRIMSMDSIVMTLFVFTRPTESMMMDSIIMTLRVFTCPTESMMMWAVCGTCKDE